MAFEVISPFSIFCCKSVMVISFSSKASAAAVSPAAGIAVDEVEEGCWQETTASVPRERLATDPFFKNNLLFIVIIFRGGWPKQWITNDDRNTVLTKIIEN